jgi:hypothetical protein
VARSRAYAVLDRLAECGVVHTADYLIQTLQSFFLADPSRRISTDR